MRTTSRYRSTRRRFLEGLGLGAGASLLLPMTDRWVSRALGQPTAPPKRLILMSVYMMEPENYRPEGLDPGRDAVEPMQPAQWPVMFAPMAPYMDRAVFLDGFRNHIGATQHRAGTSALSCWNPTNGKPESLGPAGAQTIDQYIADVLSDGAPRKSLLWGITGDALDGGRKTQSGIFAAARGQNLSHFTQAQAMLDEVFPEPSEMSTGNSNRFRPVRDRLLADLQKLRTGLASEERTALDAFEENLLDFDQRQEALANSSCNSPPSAPTDTGSDCDEEVESMMLQSGLALTCGLTRVVGITIGTSQNHNKHIAPMRELRERSSFPADEVGFYGHGSGDRIQAIRMETRRNWHSIHLRHLAGLLHRLADTTEADGSSALDHTALVYMTGNTEGRGGHHAQPVGAGAYWPALLVAGEQTGFRTGGRFMKYKTHHRGEGQFRSLADFYQTLAQGLGVDPSGFVPESSADAQGLISEILT